MKWHESSKKLLVNLLLLGGISWICYKMGQWIIPFAVAFVLAYIFHTPMLKLSKALTISTTFSSLIIISGLLFFVFLFTIFFIPILKNSIFILMHNVPHILYILPRYINDTLHKLFLNIGVTTNIDVTSMFHEYINTFVLNLPKHIFGFIDTGMTLVYIVMFVFMTPIITFYLMKDWQRFEDSFMVILNKFIPASIISIISPINSKLGAYIKGQLMVCLLLSSAYIIGLFFIGVERFIVCGIISGMLAIVPFLGALLGALITLATSLNCFSHNYQYLLLAALFLVVPFIDSNFITPKFIGKSTGIKPIWILFSICACVSVLGGIGIFISVPVAVIFATICGGIMNSLMRNSH